MRSTILIGLTAAAAITAGAAASIWLHGTSFTPASRAQDRDLLRQVLAATYPDSRGRPTPLAQFSDRILVINFWATWCPPCVKEMPDISAVSTEFPTDQVQVLGLAVDTVQRIAPFSVSHPVNYPLLALDGAGIELARKLGNTQGALPYTVVFDREGRLAWQHLGQIQASQLRKVIKDTLKKNAD